MYQGNISLSAYFILILFNHFLKVSSVLRLTFFILLNVSLDSFASRNHLWKQPVFCSPNESTDEMGGSQSSDKQDHSKERIFSLLILCYGFLQVYQLGSLVHSRRTNLSFLCANSDFKKNSLETYGNLRKQDTKNLIFLEQQIKSSFKVNKAKMNVDSNAWC